MRVVTLQSVAHRGMEAQQFGTDEGLQKNKEDKMRGGAGAIDGSF